MASATGSYATSSALKTLIGITDSTDDTLIGLICDRVNQYIESQTKQVIAPISSATYKYDGNGLKHLYLPMPVDGSTKSIGGLRAITLLEFASETGGTYETIASTDYFLRDKHGMLGPYRWLALSDLPAGSYTTFPVGFATVRITATAGWSAIPDDVTEMALNIAKTAWNAHQRGDQSVIGLDTEGVPVIQNFVGGRDRQTLMAYRVRPI